MSAIKGIWTNGSVSLSEPVGWPEGTELRIEPLPRQISLGTPESEWPTDPEGIARHLALMDRIEPFEMSPDEQAQWENDRRAQKELELSNWAERTRRAERQFE